uniref:Lymphocyte specific protein 1 n=1 Tax=Pseudonaja textilis TaxID=8673 RepID=A0A670XPZ1_PSETE
MADEQECLRDLEGEIGEQDGAEGETQRLTAQWSVEDEEEAARERRRRERERQLRSQAEEGLNSTSEVAVQEIRIDGKPPGTLELEEDEGFSDWSQKLEQLKKRSGGEGVQERDQILQGECRETQESDPIQCEESPRSPRCSYEEEDGNLKEAEVMLDQVNLDQETPTFIRFETGPSNFLKFVSTSTSEDQPEAEMEQQQQLRETLEFGEENQHAEDKLQEYVTEEDKLEEEEEKQEVRKKMFNFFPPTTLYLSLRGRKMKDVFLIRYLSSIPNTFSKLKLSH